MPADGNFLPTDPGWAASTALAYGPIVEVSVPSGLRLIVRAWAQAVVEGYA